MFSSPWGKIQQIEMMLEGVCVVSASGHGGLRISPRQAAALPECLREFGIRANDGYVWWEQDNAMQVAALVWPDSFRKLYGTKSIEAAKKSVCDDFPEIFEALTGEKPTLDNSETLRERTFYKTHAGDFIGVSAAGDWHEAVPKGMVGVYATLGGNREDGVEKRNFLVDAARYKSGKGAYGYVVDLNLDVVWDYGVDEPTKTVLLSA